MYHRKHTHHHPFLGFRAPSLLSSSSTSKNARLAVVCALQVLASDLVKAIEIGVCARRRCCYEIGALGLFFSRIGRETKKIKEHEEQSLNPVQKKGKERDGEGRGRRKGKG